ncbi:proteasome inhibitor PI31 family protein [Sporobolomyces salmoneus]|uniref:proteasome inhibitor PI31 family protein n=1 Tax=Sporobolomyces salmoneus TaxID=183962 RepID=UPI00317027BC
MSSESPLSTDRLLSLCGSLSPPSSALTSLPSAILLLLHSIHSSLSFRLIDPAPIEDNHLPSNWTSTSGLKYKHDQSSLEFFISVVDLGDKLLIVGNALNNARSSSFEVVKSDYFSISSLPSSSSPLAPSDLATRPFSTRTRLEDFVILYRLNVLQKLVPGLRKEGYEELDTTSSSGSSGSGQRDGGRLAGTRDYLPDRGGPEGVYPEPRPRGDDPLRIPRSGGRGGGGRPIGEIGRNDLEPLGGMGGTFGGGLPRGIGGFDGEGEGGGMYMGPNHPLFRERFEGDPGFGEGGRRWGGDGFLPPIGAPPGARFDPIGPENGAPGSTGPSAGLPQGTFGIGRGGRQVHPDLEQPGRQGPNFGSGSGSRGGFGGGGGGGEGFGNMFG